MQYITIKTVHFLKKLKKYFFVNVLLKQLNVFYQILQNKNINKFNFFIGILLDFFSVILFLLS